MRPPSSRWAPRLSDRSSHSGKPATSAQSTVSPIREAPRRALASCCVSSTRRRARESTFPSIFGIPAPCAATRQAAPTASRSLLCPTPLPTGTAERRLETGSSVRSPVSASPRRSVRSAAPTATCVKWRSRADLVSPSTNWSTATRLRQRISTFLSASSGRATQQARYQARAPVRSPPISVRSAQSPLRTTANRSLDSSRSTNQPHGCSSPSASRPYSSPLCRTRRDETPRLRSPTRPGTIPN